MIWNYRVTKDGTCYALREVYYDKDYDDINIEHETNEGDDDSYSNDMIVAGSPETDIFINSDGLNLEEDKDVDKESVRSIVNILYTMIDDIKQSKVIDVSDITINDNELI